VLTGPHSSGRFRARVSVRICFAAILLGTIVLATSCGGGGDEAPRVMLTDKSCTYSGARTQKPGVLEIEAKNTTSHSAGFAAYELAPGFSIEDVRQSYERAMPGSMATRCRGICIRAPWTSLAEVRGVLGAVLARRQRPSSLSRSCLGDT
jgi:hypothetical protein